MSNEMKDWIFDKIQEEKLIVEKYPFLHIRDIDGNIDTESKYPMMLLEIPNGWNKLFFQLCDDIKPVLEKEGMLYDFYFIQVKEKYNRLICYYNNAPKEVEDIISKYEIMASYICCECGKPAKFETLGYILSYCKDCLQMATGHQAAVCIDFIPRYVITTWRDGQKQEEVISFEEEWGRYVKENGYDTI